MIDRQDLVAEARTYAGEKHGKQKDKLGEPYTYHLAAVAAGVRLLGGSIEEIAAAYLHDVVEDVTAVTYGSLLDHGFPPSVVRIVWAVTKKSNEQQEKYLARILAAGEGAVRVKVADLMHNLRPDRLDGLTKLTRERLQQKYQPSFARLLMELGYLQTQEQQDEQLATVPVGSGGVWTSDYGYVSTAKDVYYTAVQLFAGDWVAGCSAPIKKTPSVSKTTGVMTFELEDGTTWDLVGYKSVRTWSKYAVEQRQKTEPKWSPAKEVPVSVLGGKGKVQDTVKQLTSGGKKK